MLPMHIITKVDLLHYLNNFQKERERERKLTLIQTDGRKGESLID